MLSALPGSDPATTVAGLVGVQAQELPSALMAVGTRSRDIQHSQVGRALEQDRSILRTWALRGTLHLLAPVDAAWLLPLIGPEIVRKSRRRYRSLGLDEQTCRRALELMDSSLAEHGPLTREQLAERLKAQGIPTAGQAIYHLLRRAGLEGVLCYGPERPREPTYVSLRGWAGPIRDLGREQALAILARRYLAAYGPADYQDLATWSGLPVGDARLAYQLIHEELLEVSHEDHSYRILSQQAERIAAEPPSEVILRLLPGYDPYLLGYRRRDWMLAARFARQIHPGGGLIRPTVIVDGMAVGSWQLQQGKAHHAVQIQTFQKLDARELAAVGPEVEALGLFLGHPCKYSIIENLSEK